MYFNTYTIKGGVLFYFLRKRNSFDTSIVYYIYINNTYLKKYLHMKNTNKSLLDKVKALLIEVKMASYTIGEIVYEFEELVVGNTLYVVGSEGNTPAPAGEYEIENKIVTVDDTGVIIEIKDKVEAADPTPEIPVEFAEIHKSIEGIEKQQTDLSETFTELSDMFSDLVNVVSKLKLEAKEVEVDPDPDPNVITKLNNTKTKSQNRESTRDRVYDRLFGA